MYKRGMHENIHHSTVQQKPRNNQKLPINGRMDESTDNLQQSKQINVWMNFCRKILSEVEK